jgi:hypothetical protein
MARIRWECPLVVETSCAQHFADGPRFRTAAQLVRDGTFPVSEAVLQSHARKHGIGKMMGRTRIFSVEDTIRLYEVLPTCRSSWSNAQSEPPRVCRRPFCLSHAAMAGSSSCA